VDEETLQKIADVTGGKYYRADNAEHFQQIYTDIDKLEKTEAIINKYAEFQELFPRFVWSGLAVFAGRTWCWDKRYLRRLAMRFEHPNLLWLVCWFCHRRWRCFFVVAALAAKTADGNSSRRGCSRS